MLSWEGCLKLTGVKHLNLKALAKLAKEHFKDSGVIIPSTFEILYIEVSFFFFFFLYAALWWSNAVAMTKYWKWGKILTTVQSVLLNYYRFVKKKILFYSVLCILLGVDTKMLTMFFAGLVWCNKRIAWDLKTILERNSVFSYRSCKTWQFLLKMGLFKAKAQAFLTKKQLLR